MSSSERTGNKYRISPELFWQMRSMKHTAMLW